MDGCGPQDCSPAYFTRLLNKITRESIRSQLVKHRVYNNVGVVKQKMKTLFPRRGEGCQGRPFFGRSSRPLTGFSAQHN